MSKAMWGGRFSKSTDEMINEFQASINFDKRMYHEDIAGSIAHATMLAKCGILTEEDRDKIVGGLEDIEQQIEAFTHDCAPSQRARRCPAAPTGQPPATAYPARSASAG